MKTSEIKSKAKSVINNIYKYVIESDDKDLWKKAIESIDKKIVGLRAERNRLIIKNSSDANNAIIELWVWESVKKQFLVRFSKKFICKNLPIK